MLFGYETAAEEIHARIDTLTRSAAGDRKEASQLKERREALLVHADHLDRLAAEYSDLLPADGSSPCATRQ